MPIEGLSAAKAGKGEIVGVRAAKRATAHLNPLRVKGLIIVDKNFNRVKLKALQYPPLCELLGKVKKGKKLRVGHQDEDEKMMLDVVRSASVHTEEMVRVLNDRWAELFNKHKNKELQEQQKDKLWEFYVLVRDKYSRLCDRFVSLLSLSLARF